MGLRPYQEQCISKIIERREANVRKQLVSKATGLGKTVTFANLPERMPRGAQMVVVAHREELVMQGAEKMAHWNPTLNIGVDMADHKADGREDVVVASIQTLAARKGARLAKYNPQRPCWLIVDECHHATAATYGNVIDYFMENPEALLVGFTATPNRADGVAMGQVFEEIVFQYGMLDGINDGWLSDVHGFQLATKTDLSKLSKKDLANSSSDKVSETVNTSARNEAIVKAWIENFWPRQTIVFTVNVQHAQDLNAAFLRSGVRSAAVWGGDPDRQKKLTMLRDRSLDVIINCQLLIEGFDWWGIEGVVLAAPSNSQARVVQEVGRGTRLDERVENLVEWREQGRLTDEHKQNVLVMDCLDVFGRHSLVTLPSLFGLAPQLDMQGQSVSQVVAAIKAAQAKFPNADLSGLTHFDELDTYIRHADMWKVKFAEETQEFSELQWSKRGDGAYMIRLPRNEFFRVTEDMVGHFDIEGVLKGHNYKRAGIASLAEAIGDVEKTITTHDADLLKLLGREQKWRKLSVSAGQMEQLQRLRVPTEYVAQMNRGAAADYITSRFNRR